MLYTRISEGLNKYKLIPITEDISSHIKDTSKDHYVSLFHYNEEHYKQWKNTNTVAGIKDVTTDKLFFDFDSLQNLEKAREDAITLITRLMEKGIKSDNIQIAFSGQKGYCIEIITDKVMTQEEFKNITFGLAGDLSTFDKVVNDSQRLTRVLGTQHPKTKLFKYPLSITQICELPSDEIKKLATDINNVNEDILEGWHEISLPESIYNLRIKKEEKKLDNDYVSDAPDLDLTKKPKWISDAKYALQMGFFGEGERNNAFMILGATYKAQGFPKEVTYRMLKGVAEIQANRSGQEIYNSKELWKNIVQVVYSPTWKGATYSYDNTPLLQDVTKRLNLKTEKIEENILVPVTSVTEIFKKFATEIDKNTIKLGIDDIDKQVRVTTSMLVGLLAPPGAGKTTIAYGVLNHLSKSGLKSDFYSLDMGAPLIYQRLIQRHTGMSSDTIFKMYQNNDSRIKEFENIISKEYDNVKFCFRSGITVDNIRENLNERKNNGEELPKLIVIDYLECLQGPYSDSTANTSFIAQQLKDLANDFSICVLLLLQPQKHAGDPSAELLSYRNIKGSSAIEQACSIVFTLWRPGFSPKNPREDRYVTIAVVKNRMGGLGMFDFSWDGLTGTLTSLDELEKEELDELRKRKAAEKAADQI